MMWRLWPAATEIKEGNIVEKLEHGTADNNLMVEMDEQDALLDRVSLIHPFLLALTGDLDKAETIQRMINNGEDERAANYYKKITGLL